MTMQSSVASLPSNIKPESDVAALLAWAVGLLGLTVIIVLTVAGAIDPALFAVSTDAGALL